jgi:hypothetical protein
MLLQDLLDTARYSELHGTAIKDNNQAIISFLNLGMLELYKRFPLSQNEYAITVGNTTASYALPDNFMYVLSVYDDAVLDGEGKPVELPINDSSQETSIYFPSHKIVQVPAYEGRTTVSVIYVGKPESYTINDLASEVDIPETLIECLIHYISYKAHLGIRGDGQAENNAHWARFERSCKQALDLGVAYPIDSLRMGLRINDRGFV